METKRNLKYFTSKGINPVFIAGLVIAAIGLILMIAYLINVFSVCNVRKQERSNS